MNQERFLSQAKSKAAKFCAGAERAPYQVLQKLLKWEIDEVHAQGIVAELIKENFVNESRFVRAYCRDKFEFNKWGKVKIQLELTRFKISTEKINEGLEAIDLNRYQQMLTSLAGQKFNTLCNEKDIWKRKQKTTAYLIRKGFEMDLSIEAVDDLADRLH